MKCLTSGVTAVLKMKRAALILTLSAALAGAQFLYSDEEFYRYLENRQQMAIMEAQARQLAHEEQMRGMISENHKITCSASRGGN